jgi:hypothetical protein
VRTYQETILMWFIWITLKIQLSIMDFHDGDHLSSKGAEKLSLILRRKIERDFK